MTSHSFLLYIGHLIITVKGPQANGDYSSSSNSFYELLPRFVTTLMNCEGP